MSTTPSGSALTRLPATEVAARVRAGELDPVDVVEASLARIAEVDPRVGAFVLVRAEEARAEAAAVRDRADLADLPLAGVPVAIKDVADVAGHPTRHGSLGTSARPAVADDTTVARLRAAGAVVVGKTRGPELSLWGTSDDAAGVARSPWDLTRTAGGSSGGSAAAVASRMVPIALASDGLGSIRIPAANCGLVGIKPGSGVVPMRVGDRDEHWFGLSQYGPLATTVDDCALMLDVLAGGTSLTEPAGYRDPEAPAGGMRVGVSSAPPAPGITVDREAVRAVRAVAEQLAAAGHVVSTARIPYGPATTLALARRWFQGAAQDVDTLVVDEPRLQSRTRAMASFGRRVASSSPVTDAQAERWRDRVAPLWRDFDVLVLPVLARQPLAADAWRERGVVANLVANLRTSPFAAPWNLADAPAMALPSGLHDEAGRPLVVQLVAPHGQERRLLAVASQLEQLRPWERHAPL
ncbi:MAG: amidase [Actinomycetes bacterium]